MVQHVTDRVAAVVDSTSTWEGVRRRVGDETVYVGLDDHTFGRFEDDAAEIAFPERLTEAVVRHDLAEAHDEPAWTTFEVRSDDDVDACVRLLRLSYLSHVVLTRRFRTDAYPGVDVDDALSELGLSPGLVHIVQELRED